MSYSSNFLTKYYLDGCTISNFERISPKQEGQASGLHSVLKKNPTRVSSLDSGLTRTLEDGTTQPIMYTPEEIFRSKRKQEGRRVSLRLNEPSERYSGQTRQQQFDNAISVMQNADTKRILADVNLVNNYENSLRTSKFDPKLEQQYIQAKQRLTADPDIGIKLNNIANAYDDVDNLRATSQTADVKIPGLKTRVKDNLNKQLKAQGKDISVDNLYLDLDDSGLTIPSYVDRNTLKGKGAGGTNYDPVVYKPTIKNDRATSRVRNKINQVVYDIGKNTNDSSLRRPITPQYVVNRGIIDTRDAVKSARLNAENAVNSKLYQVKDVVDRPIPELARDAARLSANAVYNINNATDQLGTTLGNVVTPIKNTVSNIKQKVAASAKAKNNTEIPIIKPPIQTVYIPENPKQETVENTITTDKKVKKSKKVPIKKEPSNVEQVRQLLASRNTPTEPIEQAVTNISNNIPSRLLKNRLVLGGGLAALGGAGLLGLANSLSDSNVSNNQLRQQQLQQQPYYSSYPEYY